jgi:hypothetical protein
LTLSDASITCILFDQSSPVALTFQTSAINSHFASTVAMDEPDDGMNLSIFNAEGILLNDHQLDLTGNSYHRPELSQAYILYDQLVCPLIFWTGSGGCNLRELERF